MEQHKIDRINALARKQKAEGLTAEEQAERDALRREYIDAVTGSLRSHLDQTYLVDRQGRKHKLRKKGERP
ncbi:MAG: DUF896 domain-containing protein [Oscillospiraceae bacterium]|nr:DUF896 domain-containing protein [Oscillospiraceae bacterium]